MHIIYYDLLMGLRILLHS